MENILIHPTNHKQFSFLKELLEELNVKFSTEKIDLENRVLSDFEKKLIDKGLDDIKNGKIKTKTEAHEIFEKCFK